MIQLRWARLLRRAPWFACWFVAFSSCCSVLFGHPQETDILIADFESDTYGAWTTSGEAFGTCPHVEHCLVRCRSAAIGVSGS